MCKSFVAVDLTITNSIGMSIFIEVFILLFKARLAITDFHFDISSNIFRENWDIIYSWCRFMINLFQNIFSDFFDFVSGKYCSKSNNLLRLM